MNQLLPHWHHIPAQTCPASTGQEHPPSASSIPGQCPGTGCELLPTAGAWERSAPPTGGQIWIFTFGYSHLVSPAQQRQLPTVPRAAGSETALALTLFLWLFLIALYMSSPCLHPLHSPAQIALADSSHSNPHPLVIPSHFPVPAGEHQPRWGHKVCLCSGTSHTGGCLCPTSLSLMAQFNVTPAQRKQTLPRECRREQRLREGEHGWEGIFLAPLNTSCPPPTSGSPALEQAQPTPPATPP